MMTKHSLELWWLTSRIRRTKWLLQRAYMAKENRSGIAGIIPKAWIAFYIEAHEYRLKLQQGQLALHFARRIDELIVRMDRQEQG